MPTAPLSAGRQYHPNNRRPQHRSSTAGRRAVSTSRLDLLARPRSTLLHAATAASPATGTHNAKKSPPPVTIPSNELRKSAKARSLSHLNGDPATPNRAAAPRPTNPVTRRATTVGSGVAVEKKSRPGRAPPAARSSGRNDQQETLPRLPTRGGGVWVHTRGGVVYSRNLHVATRDTSFPSCPTKSHTQLTRVLYNQLRSPFVPRFYPLHHS